MQHIATPQHHGESLMARIATQPLHSRRDAISRLLAGLSTFPLAALAGCGRPATPPASAPGPRLTPGQQIELTIWHNWGVPDPRTDYTEQVLMPRFAAEHPGLSAKIEFAGNGLAVLEKLKTNVAAGTPPDASFVYAEWTVALGQTGAIVALDPLMAAEKGFDKQDFYPHLWEALTYNGKIWGFPQNNHPFGVFYREDLFQKEAVQPPTTWEQLVEVAKRLTRDTDGDGQIDQWAFDLGAGDTNFWNVVQQSQGGRYLAPDRKSVAWNTEAGLWALEYYVALFQQHRVAPLENPPPQGFTSGKQAMTIAGPWRVDGYERSGLPVKLFPYPRGRQKAVAHANVDTWAILKTTPAREAAAFRFLAWYGSKEIYGEWAMRFKHAPLRKSIAQDPAYRRWLNEHEMVKAVVEMPHEIIIRPLTPVTTEINTTLATALLDAVQGKISPKEALQRATTEADTQLHLAAA